MMQGLRNKTKWVMIVVALAFVGLMVFAWGMDISGTSVAQQTGELGRVNGDPVSAEAYSLAYQELYQQAQAQAGTTSLSREQIKQLEDQAFNNVVNDILMQQELERRGITVSDREIVQAAQWMPHPDLMQNELFLTGGEFDISKYQQFIASPAANEDLLLSLEDYYRTTIPRSKLVRQITAGLYIGDAELWQIWRDQNETATVDYVPLNVSVLVPGDVEITEREIRDYYEENEEQFERAESGRFTVAFIPKSSAATDTAAVLRQAQAVRAEIVGGADFAVVAQRDSDDTGSAAAGGSLGAFGRGQMVPQFEAAAFSLPLNEISEPIRTDYGYHILQVQERTADQVVRARHVLLSFEPSEEATDALYTLADSLETLAESSGVEAAAQALGATVLQDVVISMDNSFVPGIGSAVEAIEWARDEQIEEEPLEVSPVFETPEAFYVVHMEAYSGPGRTSLADATADIRRQLIVDKKAEQARAIGQEIVAEARGGKPLEQAAQERGLTVETADGITRTGFNPAFGQANAATGAAFGVAIGQISDVVSSQVGLFIIRPRSRTTANRQEFEAQKDQLRQVALYQLQQESLTRWLDSLRANAEIVDRRQEAFRAQQAAAAAMPPL
jgi:peptidyl-prolyl cis-trans isomerase D